MFRVLSKFLVSTMLACAAVTATGVLPAAASIAPATSAARATANPSQGLSSSGHTQPAVTCPIIRNRFTVYRSTCDGEHATHHCNGFGPMPVPHYASNGCGVRVLLFTQPNGRGHSLCISPDTATRHLSRTYVWFRVTANRHRC